MDTTILTGVPLAQPIPTNDPSPGEERMARGIARQMARIQTANARFEAATPAKKRMILAKDVLTWIATGVMKAGSTYIMGDQLSLYEATQQSIGRETCLNGYSCEVCGIGALVVAATARGANGGKLYKGGHLLGVGGSPEIRDVLAPYFDDRQVALVELAFEGPTRFPEESGTPFGPDFADAYTKSTWLRNSEEADIKAAVEFFYAQTYFSDPMAGRDARLQAIMQNIIDNGGEFKP